MKKPTFFIIGAPKCGTTSLARWLSEHPAIYMSPLKEPHYFNSDHRTRNVARLREYERLFRGATEEHRAVGEASVWYLYSHVAIQAIREYQPLARFVVCLRNPSEMAISLHRQQLWAGNERVEAFEAAWHLQAQRLKGACVPSGAKEPTQLAYGEACRLGSQVDRLLRAVPKRDVCFLLLDDLRSDPRGSYDRVLTFLGVPSDDRDQFPIENRAKKTRSRTLRRVVEKAYKLKMRLGIYRSWGASKVLAVPAAPVVLSPAMRGELRRYFADDIRLLSSLIERNLDTWVHGTDAR